MLADWKKAIFLFRTPGRSTPKGDWDVSASGGAEETARTSSSDPKIYKPNVATDFSQLLQYATGIKRSCCLGTGTARP